MNDASASTDTSRSNLSWLLSPWTILVSMAAGVLIGVLSESTTAVIAPFGNIYLSLLQMCILPILLSAVASSLGGLVRSKRTKGSLKKMMAVFAIGLVVTSLIGVVGGLVGTPGKGLSQGTQKTLGELVHSAGADLDLEMYFFKDTPDTDHRPRLLDFFQEIIPPNIISSMTNGRNLQVLFFAVTMGIAAGFLPKRKSDVLLNLLEGIYLTFTKVIKWAMYLLPLGLCCLLAQQVSQIGTDILLALAKFVLVFSGCCLTLFIISTVIIPSALDAMHHGLGFDKTNTNLIVPLGITTCRFGSIVYFAVSTIFVAQLYNVRLDLEGLAIVLIGSILAGMATAGATGVLTLSMMLLVFEPLGLPFAAALVLFIAIDPLVDPLRTLMIVYPTCAAAALVSGQEQHISSDRIYFDNRECIFRLSSGAECVVRNVSPFGIACVCDAPARIQPDGTVHRGRLFHGNVSVGDYDVTVTRTENMDDGRRKLGLKIINGMIETEKIVAAISERPA